MARRKVKHIFVDDDTGLLIAECEGGPVVMAAALLNGRLPATHSAHFQKIGSPLPVPGPSWEGIIVSHGNPGSQEHQGDKTEVLVCLQNSEGAYEWIELGEST